MHRHRLLATESEVVRALAEASTAEAAERGVLAAVGDGLGWDVAVLWIADDEAGLLRWGASWSRDDGGLPEFVRVTKRLTFAPGIGLPGRTWSTGEPHWVPDVTADPGFPRSGIASQFGLRSATAMPLTAAGRVDGVIELLSRTVRRPDAEQQAVLSTVGGQLAHYLARMRAEERLRESEERTATIVEAALDCVITMDHRGTVVGFNAAAETTFGYSRDEAIGRRLADVVVPPDLRAAHRAGLERYLATRRPEILNRRIELTGMRADGSTFPIELTVTRVGRGEPPVFAGFVRDITGRREADREQRRLVKEAVAARAREEAARVRAETTRREAEAERRRMEFLAAAGLRMASSMDVAATLDQVAGAAVPDVADLCGIVIVDARGRLEALATAGSDPGGERLARELVRDHGPAAWPWVAEVMRSGEPALVPDVAGEAPADDRGDRLRALGARSALTVPVIASGRALGAITLLLGDSGRRYGREDLFVATALAARAGLHVENGRLYRERSRIADTLQRSLLPAALPPIPGVEVAAHYSPAGGENLVGGDFYDVFPSGDGVWTAIIGDVSGKGPEAAALTALARHTLYAAALGDSSPAHNLAFLNDAMLSRAGGTGAFCTVLYARICPDGDSAAVTLSSGGHPPPLILHADGGVTRVDVPGTLVGAFPEAGFEDRQLRLSAGELLLLYTDGAVELRRRDLEFGERQLEQALCEASGGSAEDVVRAAGRRVGELQSEAARDDVALLALRVVP